MKTKSLFEAIFPKMLKFFILSLSLKILVSTVSLTFYLPNVQNNLTFLIIRHKKMHKRRDLEIYLMTTEL